jgi:hypothetical protein
VQANLKYSAVLHEIKPLTDELTALESSLFAGAARLHECACKLAVLDERKGQFQKVLTSRTEEAAELKVRNRMHHCFVLQWCFVKLLLL